MKSNQISSTKITQIAILGAIFILSWLVIKESLPYISSILGAVALYELLIQPMFHLTKIRKWPSWAAALTLMSASFVIMVIPFVYMTSVVVDIVGPYLDDPTPVKQAIDQIIRYLQSNFTFDIVKPETISKVSEEILPMVQKTLGNTLLALGNVFLMYLILYFMLVKSETIESWLRDHLPFNKENVEKILSETKNLVYSNALGIPLVALTQGFVAVVGYWIFGVENFVLMGILTAIASVIPLVGTLVIYLPLAIYQLSFGALWEGIGVLLWGFLVIGSVDNFARFAIQKKMADVHPLVTLFGVLIGVKLMGFLGIIFGPLMISILFLMIKIYSLEYGRSSA
ncbi:MAG: AI-2E family transporter [Saprospiraceae bacterium]